MCRYDVYVVIRVKAGTHMPQHMWRSEDDFKSSSYTLRQSLTVAIIYTI